jgi:hypothetical protein
MSATSSFPRLRPAARLWPLLLALTLGACQTVEIVLPPPPELANATRLDVTGRNGWHPHGELAFGDFRTADFETAGGPIHSAHCPTGCWQVTVLDVFRRRFDEEFRSSTRTLSFALATATDGPVARVRAAAHWDLYRSKRAIEWFGWPADVDLARAQSAAFIGTIEPSGPENGAAWRFWVSETGGPAGGPRTGWAQDDRGRRIELDPWRTQPARADGQAVGHAQWLPGWTMTLDGRTIAVVDTLTAGHVWLAPGLAPDLRVAAASLSAALLLQQQFAGDPPPPVTR